MSSAAFEQMRNEIVRAGAGAGKTYRLTHQVAGAALKYFAENQRWPHVVITTFTRKATQELRERLMLLALKEKPELAEFVTSRSYLFVSTMHGVLDMYLKRYGGAMGLDPSYKILNEYQAEKLCKSVLKTILFEQDRYNFKDFSFAQLMDLCRSFNQKVYLHEKVRVLHVDDFKALFVEKLNAILSRVEDTVSQVRSETNKTDWLAMCEALDKIKRDLREGLWLSCRENILDQLDEVTKGRTSSKAPPVSDETNELAVQTLKDLKELREEIYNPEIWQKLSAVYQEFSLLAQEFSETLLAKKMTKGVIEIHDLEILARLLMKRFPETASSFASQWNYWMIDEFQDTSPMQIEIMRDLIGDRPTFVVGDPQQSIYLFRGARSEVFQAKEAEYKSKGEAFDFLQKNYRSHPSYLEFLNDFFASYECEFAPMVAKGATDGEHLAATFLCLQLSHDESQADSTAKAVVSGTELRARQMARALENETLAIVSHVQKLLREGSHAGEICVLGRTNRALLEIAQVLNQYGLSTHVHASSGFFDRREIQDLLAVLKFIVNPHDNFNLLQVLRSPWFRIDDSDLIRLCHDRVKSKDPGSMWNFVSRLNVQENLLAIADLREVLKERESKSISHILMNVVEAYGFVDLAHLHDVSGRRESNIWKLLTQLAQEEKQVGFNYLSFISGTLKALSTESGAEEGDAIAAVEPNRINLMTIHASKGLEFEHVILPRVHQAPRVTGFEDFTFHEDRGLWSFRAPVGEDQEKVASLLEKSWLEKYANHERAEHHRVLYVAMTRAVKSIFVSWVNSVEKNSWANGLGVDLEPGEHREKNYRYLVLENFENPVSNRADADGIRSVTITAPEGSSLVREVFKTAQSSWLTSRSVTQIIEGETQNGQVTVKKNATKIADRLRIANTGTLVHKLMELMKYPSREKLELLVAKWFPNREEEILEAIGYLQNFSSPSVLELIHAGEVEWGFAFLDQQGNEKILIEGQVDLWGRDRDGQLWIVDYKTGSDVHREKAFQQMKIYGRALQAAKVAQAGETIHLLALYPFLQKAYQEVMS